MMAPQQSRLASLSPTQAPILLSLNSSMLYFGTATGAAIGGAAAGTVGFAHLAWVAMPFAAAGWLLLVAGPRPGATEPA
jgi:DHA1 family inner membrane transport protein